MLIICQKISGSESFTGGLLDANESKDTQLGSTTPECKMLDYSM